MRVIEGPVTGAETIVVPHRRGAEESITAGRGQRSHDLTGEGCIHATGHLPRLIAVLLPVHQFLRVLVQVEQVTFTGASVLHPLPVTIRTHHPPGNETEDKLDLTGWVTIDNKSGAGYQDAAIKLIAGDVRRVSDTAIPVHKMMMAARGAAEDAFEEKSFMDYHLYTLGRKSTINNNQVKQIELMAPALDVPVKKLYVYEHTVNSKKVQIKLEFENKKQSSLGMPLPKGKVRVFKKDPADGMLEFVGEDRIDHTAKNEKLSLYIGDAFDITPEYTVIDSTSSRRRQVETRQIELRNSKDEPVVVFVDEKFPERWNWEIDNATHEYKKRDAETARFEITVKANSTETLKYTVTQTW